MLRLPQSQYIASPKDEYHMPMADLLVDGAAKHKVLSLKRYLLVARRALESSRPTFLGGIFLHWPRMFKLPHYFRGKQKRKISSEGNI